ncbi:MAG TPA: ribulose-phosphate 3-epimerase [Firmicutes bacterium]|nr:ribulose-phosphate 3-epimerase [Bacillota bacterium]
MIKIAPSLLAADFACLKEELAKVKDADYLHVDVMDGHFVPNISFGPPVIAAAAAVSTLPLDVHLMVNEPERLIPDIFAAGQGKIDCITVHWEACRHIHRTLQVIRNLKVRVGVSLNPATPVLNLKYILPLIDRMLIMTVNPGFGGQAFLSEVVPKIEDAARLISSLKAGCEIEVDGGIDRQTAPVVVNAGAKILVAGTAIFRAPDPARAIKDLRRASEVK